MDSTQTAAAYDVDPRAWPMPTGPPDFWSRNPHLVAEPPHPVHDDARVERAAAATQSVSALRAALVSIPRPANESGVAIPRAECGLVPSQILDLVPAVRRLCSRYHEQQLRALERTRLQRTGIAAIVAGVGLASFVLGMNAALAFATVSRVVLAVGLAAIVGVGALTAMGVRDLRRSRKEQGARFLRAIQLQSELSASQRKVLASDPDPAATFVACYSAWRTHAGTSGGSSRRRLLA